MGGAAGCLDPPPPTPRQALRPSVLWNNSNVLSFSCVYGWTVQHLSAFVRFPGSHLDSSILPLPGCHPSLSATPLSSLPELRSSCYHFLGLNPRLKLGVQAFCLNSESSQKKRNDKHCHSWFALLGLFFACFDEEKRNKCSTNWVQESSKTVAQNPASVASLAALVN